MKNDWRFCKINDKIYGIIVSISLVKFVDKNDLEEMMFGC